jgi:hypothetical protein
VSIPAIAVLADGAIEAALGVIDPVPDPRSARRGDGPSGHSPPWLAKSA